MSLRGLFLCLALIILAAPLAPRGAWAHAALVASEPVPGAVLQTAPRSIALTFSEPVAPLVFRLMGPDGNPSEVSQVQPDGPRLSVPLPAGLARGTHLLSWRVVSEDGHPIGGTLVFSVGVASGGVGAGVSQDRAPIVSAMLWLARIGLYSGLFLGIGGVFFSVFASHRAVAPSGLRASLMALLGLGILAGIVGLGAQGLDALGLSLGSVASGDVWRTGLSTSFGRTAILAILACTLAMGALRASALRVRRALASVAMLGPGLALAATGHASAADPQILMRPLVFLHASAIAWWAGALLPMAAMLHAGRGRAALVRFSTMAPFVFGILLLSGAVIAVVQLGSVAALWTTGYGFILAAKLLAVALVLVIAVHNRFALTKPVALGDERATNRLVRSIAAELALVLIVFSLAAGWRFTPPPRSLDRALPPVEVHLHGEKAMAELIVTPHSTGAARVEIEPLDGDGVPFKPMEVSVAFTPADGTMEPIRMAAEPGSDGRWQASVPGLVGGRSWKVEVDLLISDFEKAMLQGKVDLSAP